MIYCLAIFYKLDNNNAFKIALVDNMSSFSIFARGTAREFMYLAIREAVKIHDTDSYFSEIHHIHPKYDFTMNIATDPSRLYFCVMVTTSDYNNRVARNVLCNLMGEFLNLVFSKKITFKTDSDNDLKICNMSDMLIKYENWRDHDKIDKVKDDLKEVTAIMSANINKVIEKGIKLDKLILQTDNLSKQSMQFQIAAKKLNRCCFFF
jgi:hypothetical protein